MSQECWVTSVTSMMTLLSRSLVLITLLGPCTAFSEDFGLDLGLWSYHFDRTPKRNGCLVEDNRLVGVWYGRARIGTYDNTHCGRSYYVGYSFPIKEEIAVDLGAATGYDTSYNIGKLIVFPSLTYTEMFDNIGIQGLATPIGLVGVGFKLKF